MIENQNQSIIEKIRKLNALAQNAGTEQEAALAASRVAELCLKHNLEQGSVLIEQTEKEASESSEVRPGDYQAYWAYLSEAVSVMFDVGRYRDKVNYACKVGGKVVGSTPAVKMVFYGLKANTEAAVITYRYLIASVEAMLEGWINTERGSTSDTRSFRMGCGARILDMAKAHVGEKNKLIATSSSEEKAIVLVANKLVKAHAAKLHLRKSRVSGPSNVNAYQAGYSAGGRVDLHGARKSRMLR